MQRYKECTRSMKIDKNLSPSYSRVTVSQSANYIEGGGEKKKGREKSGTKDEESVKITAVYSPDSMRKFARGIALTCNRGKRSAQSVIESIFSQFRDDSIFERRNSLARLRRERSTDRSIDRSVGRSFVRAVLFYSIFENLDMQGGRVGRGRDRPFYSFHTSFVLVPRYQRKRHWNAPGRDPASTWEELGAPRKTTSLYDICDFSDPDSASLSGGRGGGQCLRDFNSRKRENGTNSYVISVLT